MAADNFDISVLIPTYNRAEILRETLEAMCQVECDGVAAEFVVIDNNSADHTKEVVESFAPRLPLRYLFEPRPGKNCALNKALDSGNLGEVLVFTDDDVTPRPDWLKQSLASWHRNPEHAIGGGRTLISWPDGKEPEWLPFARGECRTWAQDLGDDEILFPEGSFPYGTNFWIARRLFDEGLRCDESIGPSPIKRATGSEASLLLLLASKGHQMVYCPDSVVLHRLQHWLSTAKGIQRRAYTFGRGHARLRGSALAEFRRRHRRLWQLRSVAAVGYAIARLLAAYMSLTHGRRVGRSLEPITDIAYHIELLRMDVSGKEGILRKQDDSTGAIGAAVALAGGRGCSRE